jgi:PilZ domain
MEDAMGAQQVGLPNGVTFFSNLSAHYVDTGKRTVRRHGRVDFHVPVKLQSKAGQVDHVTTENVSKGGFRFSSPCSFLLGEVLLAEIHCNDLGQTMQARGRVVDRQEMQSGLFSYGIQYQE